MMKRTCCFPCPKLEECYPHSYILLSKISVKCSLFCMFSLQALRPKDFFAFIISSRHATFLYSLHILFSLIYSPCIHLHSAGVKMYGLYLYTPTCLCGLIVGEPPHYAFYPYFCYFFTPRSNCSPHITVLKHPQPMIFGTLV